MAAFAQDFTDETLERTPLDATQLLAAIGAVPEIRTALAAQNMTDDDIVEGRTLLLDCLAMPAVPTAGKDTVAACQARAATTELDAWDEPNFARYQAALGRRFPSAEAYVFKELSASRGAQAVRGVALFLGRLDALEHGSDPSRADSRETDQQAIALLAKRGLDATERKRLSALVHVVLGPTPALTAIQPADNGRRDALLKLKLWYNEWATVAHATIHKRSHLIRLGLATRHVSAPAEPTPAPAEPTGTPTPAKKPA
jgi:hypothetical protein